VLLRQDFNMKNKLSFLVAVMTLSVIFNLLTQSSSHAAATGCKKTDDSTAILVTAGDSTPFTLVGTSGYDQNQCSQEPDEYKIKFFKVALCTADPYKGAADPDFSTCSDIFNNATGVDKILKPNTETDLLEGDLLLPVGTYPYLVVIVDNHLNIKHKQKYVLASDGTSAATIIGQGGGDANTGTWCWSRAVVTTYTGLDASGGADGDHPTDYDTDQGLTNNAIKKSESTASLAQLACASSEPSDSDVVFATEIIDDLQDGDNIVTSGFVSNFDYYSALEETGVAGIEMAQNLLKNDSISIATTPNNARRLLSHFKYASPVVISDSTVGFKLRFSTYSSVSIDMSVPDGDTDIYGAKVGADPFMVQVQTKVKRSRGTWR
jgi:hypothetical protein